MKGDVTGLYTLHAPGGDVALANVHLATARRPLVSVIRMQPRAAEEMRTNIESRRRQFEAVGGWAEGEAWRGPAVVAGDFNTTSDSWLFRRYLPRFLDSYCSAGLRGGAAQFTRRPRVRMDRRCAGPG